MPIRVLIVDDEPLGVLGVRTLAEAEPDLMVVGECLSSAMAPEAIRTLRPDLVFLDVQMPGMDGFGVLEELTADEMPLVVFVTAYDQYSVRAFDVHALDYLLKPVNEKRFREAVGRARKALELEEQGAIRRRLESLLVEIESHRRRPFRFLVRSGDRITFVRVEDVEAIEARGNYMHLYRGKDTFLIRETLSNLEQRLDPARFIRTHRSWIVNIAKIREVHCHGWGEYHLVSEGGTRVPVSRHHHGSVEELLQNPLLDTE